MVRLRHPGCEATRARLAIEDGARVSWVNGGRHGVGRLELWALKSLRDRVPIGSAPAARTTVNCVAGDVRAMHSAPEFDALFQVASQFNLLEMVSPGVTPEDGVTRYMRDRTQRL